MRICPKCRRTFDDAIKYCADDGTLLTPGAASQDEAIPAPGPGDASQSQPAQGGPDTVAALQKDLETKLANYESSQQKTRNISIILLVVSLCSLGLYWVISRQPDVQAEKVPPYRKTTTPASGVKLNVDEKPGEPILLSQDSIRIKQPILVNGNKVVGDISLKNSASYPPGAPTCKDPLAVMAIDHIKPSLDGWQYSKDTKISYIVDGVEIKPPSDGRPPAPPSPSTDHTIYLERITVSPTCDTWQKIANSGSTQIRIGDALVDLSDRDRAAIKEFATALGLK